MLVINFRVYHPMVLPLSHTIFLFLYMYLELVIYLMTGRDIFERTGLVSDRIVGLLNIEYLII